nr:DEAD/DEAH box helicase [Spirochaetales bacterium]
MKFSELQLTQKTREGIEAAGFESCMPVQEKVFEKSLSGGDVMVQSQTGTGKTAAFLITILEKIAKKRDNENVKAIVIVPTRELAVQIEQDAEVLAKGFTDIRLGTFYGGIGYKSQDDLLQKGVDIFIGTPGRLMDYNKMKKLSFDKMDVVVVDEADRLFDMGFYPDILHMFQRMKPKESRQTLLFSATLTNRARNLAWDFMNEPTEVDIEPDTITVNEIRQELLHISKSEKFSVLLRILAKENPQNAIIFTNTKSMAVEVAKRLEVNGYDAHVLMGDLPQSKRLRVIQKMKQGTIRFLAATDVAARGLHVDDLELVVNYDVPEDFENYVHRVGRTARAGKSGLAITLACEQFVYGLESIEDYIHMKIPVVRLDEEVYPSVLDKSANLRFRDLVRSYRSDSRGPKGKTGRSASR